MPTPGSKMLLEVVDLYLDVPGLVAAIWKFYRAPKYEFSKGLDSLSCFWVFFLVNGIVLVPPIC